MRGRWKDAKKTGKDFGKYIRIRKMRNPPTELHPFTQKYRLKKTQTALAYWALDKKKERKKLADRLLRFV